MRGHKSFHTPMVNRRLPAIKTHNFNTVKDSLPSLSQAEVTNTGIARLGGRMTAMYPKISGFNSGPGGAIMQPLVTQTGFNPRQFL